MHRAVTPPLPPPLPAPNLPPPPPLPGALWGVGTCITFHPPPRPAGFAWTGSLGPITRMLNTLVVLLPFFTIANAFPLNAHALANNLMTSIHPKTWRALLGISEAQEGEEQPLTGGEAWPPMRVKVVARLMCTVPPFLLVCACLFTSPALVQSTEAMIASAVEVMMAEPGLENKGQFSNACLKASPLWLALG